MNVSKLDRPAQLFVKQTQRGTSAEIKDVWTAADELWVSKPTLTTGKLAEIAAKSSGTKTFTFETHYHEDIKEYTRIVVEGVSYDVTVAQEKGYHEGMLITATVTL